MCIAGDWSCSGHFLSNFPRETKAMQLCSLCVHIYTFIFPSKCEYFHQVWQKGTDLKGSEFLKMFTKLGKLIERYISNLQLKEWMWLSHLHQPLTSQHWHKKSEKTRQNPSHHPWSCQLFNVPVKCKNAGKVIPALTVYGTGFLWSSTKGFYI